MVATTNLGLTELATNQTNKETTINNALVALDAAIASALAVTFTSNARTLTATEFTRAVAFVASNQTATGVLTVPLTHRLFVVKNDNATYGITVKGATGGTATVPPSSMSVIYCDGVACFGVAGGGVGVTSVSGHTGIVTLAQLIADGLVSSVAGYAGTVTLAQLVTAGLAPEANPVFTGTADASGAVLKVATPSASTDAASKAYVDGLASGLVVKPQATVATTAALAANTYANGTAGVGATLTQTATGAITVDGHVLVAADVVLVNNEATASHNGLYTVTTAGTGGVAQVLTRHTGMDTTGEFANALVPVGPAGVLNKNSSWLSSATTTITVGTTAVSFSQISGGQGIPANLPYTVGAFVSGLLNAGQVVLLHQIPGPVNFPANFGTSTAGGASRAVSLVGSTATVAASVLKCPAASDPTVGGNFTNVGTITFAAGHTGAFTSAGGTTAAFAADDYLKILAPGTADVTLADLSITLVGDRP